MMGFLCISQACGVDPLRAVGHPSDDGTHDGTLSNTEHPPEMSSNCAVEVAMGDPWDRNGVRHGMLHINVRNTGSRSISVPWTLILVNQRYVDVQNAWGWTATVEQGFLRGEANGTHQLLSPHELNGVAVGGEVVAFGDDLRPTSALLNGQVCQLSVSEP